MDAMYVCLFVCPLCIQPLLNGFEQYWALNDHCKACQAIVNFLEGCIANFLWILFFWCIPVVEAWVFP